MTDSVRRHNGRLRDRDGWWIDEYRDYIDASAYDQLSARLAASEAEVARAHAAETLADERWMRDGELRDAAEAERDSLRDKLAKLEVDAAHKPGGARMRLCDSFIDSVRQPCTCGLAALQSSEERV